MMMGTAAVETVLVSITATPEEAVVTINGKVTNTLRVFKGTDVTWEVSLEGYIGQNGKITSIQEDFTKNVVLEVDAYIEFQDPEVERICVEKWSADGIGLRKSEAAKINRFYAAFKSNSTIRLFNELKYFQSVVFAGGYDNADFNGCTALEEISLPDNSEDHTYPIVPNYLLKGKAALRIVSGYEKIRDYPEGVFRQDPALILSFDGNTNVRTIGSYVFEKVQIVGPLNLPSLETIGTYAFGATNLVKITNLGIVQKISSSAFADCKSLTDVILPSTVTEVANYAFRACPLVNLRCLAINPPILGTIQVFQGHASNFSIFVPDESVEAYKAAEGWITYADKIKPLSEYNV